MRARAEESGIVLTANNAIEQLNTISEQTEADYSKQVEKYGDFIAFKSISRRDHGYSEFTRRAGKIKNPEYSQWKELGASLLTALTFKTIEVYAPPTHIIDKNEVERARRQQFKNEWKSYKDYIQRKQSDTYSRNYDYFFGELGMSYHSRRQSDINEHARFMRSMRDMASSVELLEVTLNDEELSKFANTKSFIKQNLKVGEE